MENASNALLMAFAVMVLVIALTVSMVSLTKAKQTADIVLHQADETNYYEYQGQLGKAAENRIVGLETIIPTLYKYYKENYTVVFREGYYDASTGDLSGVQNLTIYTTKDTMKKNWTGSYYDLMKRKYGEEPTLDIFSFDLDEETLRHEPWTGSYDKIKENLDCFLNGGIYKNPNDNSDYINYKELKGKGFLELYAGEKFVETITEYTNESSQNEEITTIKGSAKKKTKRMIIYTLISK